MGGVGGLGSRVVCFFCKKTVLYLAVGGGECSAKASNYVLKFNT